MSQPEDNKDESTGSDEFDPDDEQNKQANRYPVITHDEEEQQLVNDDIQSANAGNQSAYNLDRLQMAMPAVIKPSSALKHQHFDVVEAWRNYFGDGNIEDWIRMCHKLTLEGDLSTKYKCRKALSTVWVNIWDFLETPEDVALFASEDDLSEYTCRTKKVFPTRDVVRGTLLQVLLAYVRTGRPNYPQRDPYKLADAPHTWSPENWIVESNFGEGK